MELRYSSAAAVTVIANDARLRPRQRRNSAINSITNVHARGIARTLTALRIRCIAISSRSTPACRSVQVTREEHEEHVLRALPGAACGLAGESLTVCFPLQA